MNWVSRHAKGFLWKKFYLARPVCQSALIVDSVAPANTAGIVMIRFHKGYQLDGINPPKSDRSNRLTRLQTIAARLFAIRLEKAQFTKLNF